MSVKIWSKRKHHQIPPSDAVYVGRPTKWGNPFVVGTHGDTGECAKLFWTWLNTTIEGHALADEARNELAGKDLICWCLDGVDADSDPLTCHGQALAYFANRMHNKAQARLGDPDE